MEEINLVFENSNLLVIDKPPYWVTTTEGRVNENTKSVERWIKNKYGFNLKRQGIVHRLDKGTSGLVLAAKNEHTLEALKKQFKERKVEKKYIALAGGDLPQRGEIDMPTGRSPYGFGKFAVVWNGRPSKTNFVLLGKYRIGGKIYSLLEVGLKTGRTHQIRIHFKYMGWPLLGDVLYGGIGDFGDRQFLHAARLAFYDPENGGKLEFESALPKDLQVILDNNEKLV